MCRQHQVLGYVTAAFSAGLVLGSFCEFGFGIFLVGMAGVCLGFSLAKKK